MFNSTQKVSKKDSRNDEPLRSVSHHWSTKSLTPLMLKHIKAHERLCVACSPDYADTIYDQADEEAQSIFEKSC